MFLRRIVWRASPYISLTSKRSISILHDSTTTRAHLNDGRAGITSTLVSRLIASQFPQWRNLPIVPVPIEGNDNRTYRLGNTMSVRLPIAAEYAPAVAKEHEWLPRLAPFLPATIPKIVAVGMPEAGYEWTWSVREWLEGETANVASINDMDEFADGLASFVLALQRLDPTDGPLAGAHSWFRGASPAHYDAQVQDSIVALSAVPGLPNKALTTAVWSAALTAKSNSRPVWFHGDMAPGNLLVNEGKLSAVIDFGTCGVGDPACDLAIAWTFFTGANRDVFRRSVAHDHSTWARARGWALWKALLLFKQATTKSDSAAATGQMTIIRDVIEDHLMYGLDGTKTISE